MLESPLIWNGLVMNDQARRNYDYPDEPYWIKVYSIDGLWDSEIRYEAADLPGAHGSRSGDSFFGGKDIVITGEVRAPHISGLRQGQRRLQVAFADLKEHELEYRLWDETPLVIAAKRHQRLDMPEEQADSRFARSFTVAVRADDPRSFSKTFESVIINSIGIYTPATRTYDIAGTPRLRDYDPPSPETRKYAGGVAVPLQGATNAGNADADPIIRIYGDMTNPEIINRTTGELLTWSNLQIPGGDYLEVDTAEGTVKLNGLTELYTGFDFVRSEFFKLAPGFNELAVDPDAFVTGARVEVYWRNAYL